VTFADYILQCRVFETQRGELIDEIRTLINAGQFPAVQCWADLYRFLSRRHSTNDATIMQARQVWNKFKKANSLEAA